MSLSINALCVCYGSRPVIHNLSLPPLPSGSLVALVGPNGAGKSTLLRALAGLEPMKGGLSLDGVEVTRLSFAERARRLSYMPQQLPPGIALGVLESIIVGLRVSGADNPPAIAFEALRQLGIEHLAERGLDALSGGQKQLVALAQLLARNPQVLLLDEPTSALDLHYQLRVMDAVRQRVQAQRLLAIAVLHDINLAARHADTLVMLSQGRVVACGTPQEVLQPALLAEVYGVHARVERCSQDRLQVLVDRAVL